MKRNILFSLLLALTTLSIVSASFAQDAQYSVDFTKQIGDVRPINGVNLWHRISYGDQKAASAEAEACAFSTVRLHDTPWDNTGLRLVDVHQIFGNLDADPNDPKNYFFAPTDDLIADILASGSVPVYRLGTSIEHSQNKYFAKRPQDPEHYAEICAGIVRHYNAGWADGHEWNLPYWEIWNEPDVRPQMWDSDYDAYCQFYVVVAKRLRKEFPNIKIGGPALAGASPEKIKTLIDLCKAESAPLDFFSWHNYTADPAALINTPAVIRKMLDDAGFANTELHLNEWHYFPCTWGDLGNVDSLVYWSEAPQGLHGYVSAAFNDFVLTRWQDTPLTMSNYYSYSYFSWGVFDQYGRRRLTYYSLSLFGELVSQSPKRVETIDGGGSVALLAGVDKEGANPRLLVSVFKRDETTPIQIALNGTPESGKVKVAKIGSKGFEETELEYANNVLTLEAEDSGVFLVRF